MFQCQLHFIYKTSLHLSCSLSSFSFPLPFISLSSRPTVSSACYVSICCHSCSVYPYVFTFMFALPFSVLTLFPAQWYFITGFRLIYCYTVYFTILKDLKIFTLTGELVEKVGRNLDEYPMKAPTGLAVNSKGEIVVSDSSRKCVYVYPIEGAFCEIIWGEVCQMCSKRFWNAH